MVAHEEHNRLISQVDIKTKFYLYGSVLNGSNSYKMRLVDYAVTANFQPPMNFQLNYLNIDFDVTVYKIGSVDQFIDINTLSFYQILFEEKRNSSLV